MTMHIVYRSVASESGKQRPRFYSKLLCLLSLLWSTEGCAEPLDVIFLNDGPVAADIAGVMRGRGEIVELPNVGKFHSLRAAISLVDWRAWKDEDIVYFAEDDYLYTPNALPSLLQASRAVTGASYFTLYDYPGWYTEGDPYRGTRHEATAAAVWWRAVESTTHSFGARVAVVRTDAWLLAMAAREGVAGRLVARSIGSYPEDRAAWCALQGLRPYAALEGLVQLLGRRSGIPSDGALVAFLLGRRLLRRRLPARALMCPAPGLATHMESRYLARDVDWRAIAEATASWAERNGIAESSAPALRQSVATS
jgi:hypothetical protein